MLIHCHSKKCNTTREHKLRVEANEAICLDCGENNSMVSEFMKSAMKSSGDIYRSAQSKAGFMYKCPKCLIDRAVKIVDEQAVCGTCNHPIKLSESMIHTIKTMGADNDKTGPSEAKSELSRGVVKRKKMSV